ncbi:MAG TPA: BrnT family toxin [Caulobacteraceae bacterium]|nr:BrnT family toxin [Caulobacteraceae bacterium]
MITRFEWDPAKALANARKHDVTFHDAIQIFDDPFALSEQDRVEGGEYRWQTIGMAGDAAVLLVAHTSHDLDEDDIVVRVISARRADRRERKRYEQAIRDLQPR